MSVTPNRPSVSVPVLSKTTAWIFRARSKAARSLMRRPLRAEIEVEMATTRGTANPSACGQAMTMTVTIRSRAKAKPRPPRASQAIKVSAPTPTAITVSHMAALSESFWVLDLLSWACRTRSITWER